MPLKKSKVRSSPHILKKTELVCSKKELEKWAAQWSATLKAGDCVFLEGQLGAGKTTFAQAVLMRLHPHLSLGGSPTFPLVHEYFDAKLPKIFHMDLYRLNYPEELEMAGIPEYFWESKGIVLCEWISKFPKLRQEVIQNPAGRVFEVQLDFIEGEGARRRLKVFSLSPAKIVQAKR